MLGTHHDEFDSAYGERGGNGNSINMDDNDSNKTYTVCCCRVPIIMLNVRRAIALYQIDWSILFHSFAIFANGISNSVIVYRVFSV